MIKTITTEEFFEKHQPIKNHFVQEAAYEDCMFETYGEEVQYIVNIFNSDKKQYIWTLLEVENEESWIIPGYHYFNRLGYFITKIPWENENIQVNNNKMCTIDEAIDYCIDFGETAFNIGFDKNDVTQHFSENLDSTFDIEMTIGRAKYTAIDYYVDRLSRELDEFDDEIHNYYSQLK